MSKKVNVISPGISRGNLVSLFKQYVVRKVEEEKEYWRTVGRCLGGRYPNYLLYDDDDEYDEEMAKLRAYYSGEVDDDYYVDDDGSIIFPSKTVDEFLKNEESYWDKLDKLNSKGKYKHRKHRGSRGRNKKAKVIDINTPYSGSEDLPFTDEADIGTGKIFFYPNYEDKYDRLEFNSLVEFDEYCQEEGYCVPPYVGEVIAYKPVSHCCLNPYAKEHGVLEVMAEESYADMCYEAREEVNTD